MRYWYCKDTSDGQTWLYMGTIRPVKDESGDWTCNDDEEDPTDWLSKEDIVDLFGEDAARQLPDINPGKIVEIRVTFTIEIKH